MQQCNRFSNSKTLFLLQYNQWICLTTKRRAQNFPSQGITTFAQSKITQCLSSTGKQFDAYLFSYY